MLHCMYCEKEVDALVRDGEYHCCICGNPMGKAD
jgi:hypothetical protein